MKLRIFFLILISLTIIASNISLAEQKIEAGEGRFQIFFSPHARADAYLVDTKTGKVWANVQYTDVQGQPRIWIYQERIDNLEDFMLWIGKQKLIESNK